MKPSLNGPRSSRIKTDEAKTVSVKEELWSYTVAMIMEKSADYKKYVKAFEEGYKSNSRPVIKLIGPKDVGGSSNPGVSTDRRSRTVKLDPNPKPSGDLNKAEQIVTTILKMKADDMSKMNQRDKALERCEDAKPSKAESPQGAQRAAVHDEPLCGPSLYIVLTGFYEAALVFQLLQLNIPLELVLAFDENPAVRNTESVPTSVSLKEKSTAVKKPKSEPQDNFWKGYDEYLKDRTNMELTSNTIVLNCDPKECLEGKENLKAKDVNELTYEYVCAKMYSVQNDRRRYVDFIRNIKETRLVTVPRLTTRDMKRYCGSIRAVPLEVTRADHVLCCILEQIEYDEQSVLIGGRLEEAQQLLESTTADGGLKSETSTKKANEFSDVGEETLPLELGTIVPPTNLTPFVIEYRYRRKFDLKNRQVQFDKLRNNYCKILEGLICPKLWRFFPQIGRQEKLYAKSHLGKIRRYFKFGDDPILEACLHKRIFNRMILSTVDSRNVDPNCEDVFDAFCGCGLKSASSLSSTGKKMDDGDCGDGEEEEEKERLLPRDRKVQTSNTGQDTDRTGKTHGTLSVRVDVPFTPRTTLDLGSDESQEEQVEGQVPTLNQLIKTNEQELNLLTSFLKYPELDTLFNQSYDTLERYNVFEMYSKETCLSLLNVYCSVYDLVDYVYYGPTDSILFVFHRNTDNKDLVQISFSGYLLTAVGFRDYYNTLTKTYPYLPWIAGRGEAIAREDQELLEKFKVILNEDQKEKCCFENIKKYGVFPVETSEQFEVYSSHVPHPRLTTSQSDCYSFLGFHMDTSCHVRCNENSTSYVSKRGIRISCKSYDLFDPLKTFNHVSLTCKACSIHFDVPNEVNDFIAQKVVVETDDIRITYSDVNSGDVLDATSQKRSSVGKDGLAHRRKFSGNTVEAVKSEDKRQSDYRFNDFDATITLPNGLEVTIYRLNDQVYGVKQRHLDKRWRDKLGEKYRVYLKDGTVMAFMEDDTVTVYYSNTTITKIKRVSKEKQLDNFCGNEASTRTKRLTNLTLSSPNDYLSEKNLERNTYYVIGEHQVVSWSGTAKHFRFGFPWETVPKYRLRTAYKPGTELFTLRTDGTKSILNPDGELVVQFPDGTKITSTPRLESVSTSGSDADDLDSGEDNDEWINVILDILVEQPTDYLPVRSFDDCWTVSLDANKTFTFDQFGSTILSMSESELCSDQQRRCIRLSAFESDPIAVSYYTIYFDPEESGTVCTFSDESVRLTVDTRAKVSLEKTQISEETSLNEFNHVVSRFDSIISIAGQSITEEESHPVVASKDDDSFYVVKPTASQRDFKLVCLNRDLTGCQLIQDMEDKQFDNGINTIQDSGKSRHNLTKYDDAVCTVIVWNLLPEAQTFPTEIVSYKSGYLNPHSFASTELRRCMLSGYLDKNTVWLFLSSRRRTPSQMCDMLADRAATNRCESRTGWNGYERREEPVRNRVVTMLRRCLDLDRWDGHDSFLQIALQQYLDYKKRIYSALLANSINQINARLAET